MTEPKVAHNFFERHGAKIAFAGPADCWLWVACEDSTGYGALWRGKKRHAHREAYEAANGPIPDGLVVRHRCDTPLCVNPAHLEPGTQGDNMRDRDRRGRQVAPKGEVNGQSKLTESDVRAIRALYVPRSPGFGQKALARRYGVAPSAIGQIISRQRWKHVA